MKAIIYCRKSTDREDLQQNTLEYQATKTRETAKQYNLKVIKEIIVSESAKTEFTRKGFNEMVELCKKGKIDYIIIDEPKRLSRNNIDTSRIIDLMDKKLIKGILATGRQYLSENSRDKFLLQLDLSISKMDNEDRRAETIKKMQKILKDGRFLSKAPYGYKNVGPKGKKDIIIDETTYKNVQFIFDLKIQGYGNNEIIKELAKKGVTMKPTSIENILKNEFYIGILKYNIDGTNYIGQHKHGAIIEKSIFELAQSRRVFTPNKNDRNQFVLKGIIKDYYTKKPLVGYIQKGNVYYKNSRSEIKINISQKSIIEKFGEYIELYSIPKQFQKPLIDGIKAYYKDLQNVNQKDITAIKQKIANLNDRKTKILNLYCDNGIDANQYKEFSKNIEYDLLDLQNKLNELQNNDNMIDDDIPKVFELLANMNIMRSKANDLQKGVIFQNIVFELFVDEKKQLHIREYELFYNIRNYNKTGWYSIRGNLSNFYNSIKNNYNKFLYKIIKYV